MKSPRLSRRRVSAEKKPSTAFSHEAEVGVKWNTQRGWRESQAGGWVTLRPQGPSLGSGLCCPGPSSLNRPHPPHSQAHRDFTAERLIRDAFAVRERRGDPRVVPGFRYHSVLTCRPL